MSRIDRVLMRPPYANALRVVLPEGQDTQARLNGQEANGSHLVLSPSLTAIESSSFELAAELNKPFIQTMSLSERLKRQRTLSNDPSGRSNVSRMVRREEHPLNKGKLEKHCTGLPGKLYDKFDLLEPILDSMKLMYHKLGWSVTYPVQRASSIEVSTTRFITTNSGGSGGGSSGRRSGTSRTSGASSSTSGSLCRGCYNPDRNGFLPTSDKSHMTCKLCGVVSSPIHVATDREKNCAREDDKTTHADRPFQSRTDRFDHPAKTCDELRKEREQSVVGSRIGKRAKQKNGLGWSQENSIRQAAKAERERQEMEPRDATKGNHIQQELDKLFAPLEPISNEIKRFFRIEADRAWREAVKHSRFCSSKSLCQLNIKDRGPAVIAEAVFACSLATLLEGNKTLNGVTHSGLLVLADKRVGLQQHKGTSSAHRAVHTIVSTLLANDKTSAIPECKPLPKRTDSFQSASQVVPFSRCDSGSSDLSEVSGELIQLRNQINRVHKAMGPSVRRDVLDGALKAIQVTEFRASLVVMPNRAFKPLTQSGVAFVILNAVSLAICGAELLDTTPSRLLSEMSRNTNDLRVATDAARAILPSQIAEVDDSADFLF